MKKMKRSMIGLLLVIAAVLAGCGAQSEEGASANSEGKSDGGFPEKPITVVVSFAAGGGTDVGARILLPYVEEELGVPITVVNKPGGGGWVGWNELVNSKTDGYTIGYINTPNLMTGYMNPELNRDNSLEDFDMIANHVTDYGAIAVAANDDRFDTIEDLIEFAKENTVTTTSTGVGSDDHILAMKLNEALGTKFEAVHGEGAANGKAGVLGGHVDVYFANVGEVAAPAESGELKALAVSAPERSEFMEDVPTLEEKGFGEIYGFSARGVAYPAGMDEEVMKTIQDAFEKALNNPDQVQKMADMGLAVDPLIGEDYYNFLKEEEEVVEKLKPLMGW